MNQIRGQRSCPKRPRISIRFIPYPLPGNGVRRRRTRFDSPEPGRARQSAPLHSGMPLGCLGTWPQKKLGAPRQLLAVVAHFLPDALGATRNRFM